MKSAPVFLIIAGIATSMAMDLTKICQDVRNTDAIICAKIQNPTISERDKVFQDISDYLKTLPPLHQALQADTDRTLEVCKDVIAVGTSQFMNIVYDYDQLVQGFGWTHDDMNKYRDLRDNVLTEWLKIEPFIPANREATW